MKKCSDVKLNKKVIIKKIDCENPMRRRILDMGLTTNTPIVLTKVAPLGDPYEISVRGYTLTLRKQELEHIYVEEVDV